MGKLASARRKFRSGDGRWGRRGVAVAAVALGAGLLAGVSGATSPSVDVNFTPLNPPKKVLSNASIGANATRLVILSGGSTTVPTNATTLELLIAVRGSKAGTLSFYPAGDPAGSSGQTVSWNAGGSNTATITTDIGQKNQIAIKNTSLGSAITTVTITGYSTEVEADDISGKGGTAGQVLTNDGSGGVNWQTPGRALSQYQPSAVALTFGGLYVATLAVPAGSYMVSFDGTLHGPSGTPDYAHCWLFSPAGFTMAEASASVGAQVLRNNISLQGLVNTSGGTIGVYCWSQNGQPMNMQFRSLIAQKVGQVSGSVTNQRVGAKKGIPKR